jgi:hypothetical protein
MNNYPAGVTDNDPHFDLPDAHESVCQNCNGTGIAGYATHEMALDAGDAQLEGQIVACPFCETKGN